MDFASPFPTSHTVFGDDFSQDMRRLLCKGKERKERGRMVRMDEWQERCRMKCVNVKAQTEKCQSWNDRIDG